MKWPWSKTPDSADLPYPKISATSFQRIVKNRREYHNFRVVSGYDPERDGDDPQWGRVAVECRTCGEQRRIGCSIAEVNTLGGCVRHGNTKPKHYDHVVTPEGYLDYYINLLPNGKVSTYNAGGTYHENNPEDLKLVTTKGYIPLNV